jgi:hypothetical protein
VNFVWFCCTRLGISCINGIENVIGQEGYGRRKTRILEGGNGAEEVLGIQERVLRDELCSG